MITLWIFQSLEFYVIATLVAAIIVGLAAKPSSRGEARQYLLAGDLTFDDEYAQPAITLTTLDNGKVVLQRHAVEAMTTSGAVSLAITQIGTDITIEERLSDGYTADSPVDTATFYLDFMGAERYHIKYNSDATGLFAAFTFSNRPGYKTTKLLNR